MRSAGGERGGAAVACGRGLGIGAGESAAGPGGFRWLKLNMAHELVLRQIRRNSKSNDKPKASTECKPESSSQQQSWEDSRHS